MALAIADLLVETPRLVNKLRLPLRNDEDEFGPGFGKQIAKHNLARDLYNFSSFCYQARF